MSLKQLLFLEMLAILEMWIDPRRARAVFERYALLAATLPMLDALHRRMTDTLSPEAPDEGARRAQELTDEGVALDRLHDRKARAAWSLLEGAILAADDDVTAQRFTEARDRLFPDGVAVVQGTWMAEVGNASRLKLELEDTALRETLAELRLNDGETLLSVVKSWRRAGQRLGQVVQERSAIADVPATDSLREVRNTWMTLCTTLGQLRAVAELSPEDDRAVFGPLDELRARAGRRASAPAAPQPLSSDKDDIGSAALD